MSIRLKAKLTGEISSDMEAMYLRDSDAVVLENQRVEMVVDVTQGFMEHESPAHEYLPCFHMIGQIRELRGDFPYGVSALYFDGADEGRLTRDFYYYPTPEELSHLILTGKFYSKYFNVPEILSDNTYTLPCVTDMIILPPPDPVSYEMNAGIPYADLEDEDKLNIPVFYVGITGTGVSKRNDKLLDYYGLDFESGFDQFVLTAESSGYKDPPLLEYITEPVMDTELQNQTGTEYHITSEEEEEMLLGRTSEPEAVIEEVSGITDEGEYREPLPEDAVLAQADRNVAKRIERRLGTERMSLENMREEAGKRREREAGTEPETGNAGPKSNNASNRQDPQMYAEVKMDFDPERNIYVQKSSGKDDDGSKRQEAAEEKKAGEAWDAEKLAGADVQSAEAQVKVDEAHTRDITRDVAVDTQKKTSHREVSDSMRDLAEQLDNEDGKGDDGPDYHG